MNERAFMGTIFAAGVLTALVAGFAGWQLGRPRSVVPTDTPSTTIPPDPERPAARPGVPPAEASPAPAANAQKPAGRRQLAVRPVNRPAETAGAVAAPAAAPAAPPAAAATDRASAPPPAGTPSEPPALPRAAGRPDRSAATALPPLQVATPVPATMVLAVRTAEAAATPRLASLTHPRRGEEVRPSAAPAAAAERPVAAMLAPPVLVAAEPAPIQVLASVRAPLQSPQAAPAALPGPSPALQPSAAAPFVASVVIPTPGEAHAGDAGAAMTERQAGNPVRADPVPGGSSVASPPGVPQVAPPRAPAPIAGPAAAPNVAILAPADPEVTAAISPVAGSAPPPDLGRTPPSRAHPVGKRRRLTVMTPPESDLRAPGVAHRASKPARRSARHSLVDGAVRPRSPVTIVYGTALRPEFGPVLIRIHPARGGAVRVTRVPLD
jgi:hypothetical protein